MRVFSRYPLPLVLAAVSMAVYGGLSLLALWAWEFEAFRRLVETAGTRFWNYPFFDHYGVLSWGECQALGYDVMSENPCDPLGRPLNYSPLFRYLPLGGTAMTIPGGYAMGGLFLAAAAFILRPRTRGELLLAFAAIFCPFVVGFALERANTDIAIFTMIAAGVWLVTKRGASRYWGYGLYLIAAVLKFYPVILLATVAREKPRTAFSLAALCALILAIYLAAFWSDFLRIPGLLPNSSFTLNHYGAAIVARATAHYLGLPPVSVAIIILALVALSLFAASRFQGRIRPIFAAEEGTSYPFNFLIAGALLMIGTFLAQENIPYRAVFFLFVLPGLLHLRGRDALLKPYFSLAVAAVFLCLWESALRLPLEGVIKIFAADSAAAGILNTVWVAFFYFREAVWWTLVAFLIAILMAYFAGAPALRPLAAWRKNPRVPKALVTPLEPG